MKKDIIVESIKNAVVGILSILVAVISKDWFCNSGEVNILCEYRYELILILSSVIINIVIYWFSNRNIIINLNFKEKANYKRTEELNIGFGNSEIMVVFLEIDISNNNKKSKGMIEISFPKWIDLQVEEKSYYNIKNNKLIIDLHKMLSNKNETEKFYLKVGCAKSEKRDKDDSGSVDFIVENLKNVKVSHNQLHVNYC